ncbi:MAG TPA: hypothetical protein VKA67_10655, partial [Verrucomicrobiae bacterium]|nr:hypothetical protein [Verrucomicrobiae bacterium]
MDLKRLPHNDSLLKKSEQADYQSVIRLDAFLARKRRILLPGAILFSLACEHRVVTLATIFNAMPVGVAQKCIGSQRLNLNWK